MAPTDQFDIIFVGGGAAGNLAAGRLAAANPSLRVLVLEAGAHSYNVPVHVQPARYVNNFLTANSLAKNFTIHIGQPEPETLNRPVIVPSGRTVGGGSSVNFMMYTRGSASDYDAWETRFGNPGWGSKNLIPLAKSFERYQPLVEASGEEAARLSEVHGTSGPLSISFQKDHTNVHDEFLRASRSLDKKRSKVCEDFNDFKTINAFGPWPRFINANNGRRSDTAHNFLYNNQSGTQLEVRAEKRVVRVLFEGTKAVGVEYIDHVPENQSGPFQTKQVFASKLVVLSAGAFGSPAILERSGVGAKDILEKNGIPQIVDLPGVGENYMDHNLVLTHYRFSDDAETDDIVFRAGPEQLEVFEKELKEKGTGWLTHNGVAGGVKLRPFPEELEEIGPEFKNRWDTFFAGFPDKPMVLVGLLNGFYAPGEPLPFKAVTAGLFSAYPESLGRVHIANGLDTYAPLNFKSGFLNSEADLVILRWTYKYIREILRRTAFYRGEIEPCHPRFSETSDARCNKVTEPVPIDAPKIKYTKEDDDRIDEFIRATVGTTWHSAGTCAMKARDAGGVVDSKLNVYGTSNLKVADMSIIPENVAANTYNTALIVGTKAATIIAEELGLQL